MVQSELSGAKEQLSNLRIEKEELELKLGAAPSLEQKALEGEEKAKATEDKFQKIKTMYTQIRDEHVNLLRQVTEKFQSQLSKCQYEHFSHYICYSSFLAR